MCWTRKRWGEFYEIIVKNMNENKLLEKVLNDFKNHIKENWNWLKELEKFHHKVEIKKNEYGKYNIKNIINPIINNDLEKLSKEIVKKYQNIKLIDIYNLIPGILRKINLFIWFDSEKINVDYYYILSWNINFIPNSEKPNIFWDFKNNLEFYKEVIFKTLDDVDEKYQKFYFNFTFKIPFKLISNKDQINIDDRIDISYTEDNTLEIKWNYKEWYILEKFYNAFKDLTLIINILELNNIFVIKDINKSFWEYSECSSCEEYDISNFKYSNIINNPYWLNILYIKEHLKRFNYLTIWSIDLKYFYLLSEKIKNTNLITASYFFWTELKRFDSQIFLSYWQAIEIMLWSPENNIKKELENKFKLFFPNNDNRITTLWKVRCDIVHNWKLEVDNKDLKEVKDISKQLFLKLIVSNYY